MCDEKLSSDAVPHEFTEWLLEMGCPTEKVPTVNKVSEMCRGQYYMVWRSLMTHVHSRDIVRHKRLQVFCDDVRMCQNKNVFYEHDTNTVVPEQLSAWRRQAELKDKVAEAEARVELLRRHLHQLTEKISDKLGQRNLSRRRVADAQRRAWLLQQNAAELSNKQHNLRDTAAIARSLCDTNDSTHIQSKLDRCLNSLRRQAGSETKPDASSTVVPDSDFESQLSSLVRCRGDALCSQLYERRAALVAALSAVNACRKVVDSPHNRLKPQSVLSHTAALHCTLALEATKNRLNCKQVHKRLAAAVTELNNYLTGEACELLVVRCEKAHVEARVVALRLLLDELTTRSGVFETSGEVDDRTTVRPVATVDRAIENTRDELKTVMASLTATERKIQSVRECLTAVFNGFHKDLPHNDSGKLRGLQVDMPQESIASIRQFYESRHERRRGRMDLSLELEISDGSFGESIDMNNPRFMDELKIYLKKFSLEKNRKLILESGEKIWTFEALDAAVARLHAKWLADEVHCGPLSPAGSLRNNLRALLRDVGAEGALAALRGRCAEGVADIDIKSRIEEEEQTLDKIKKRLKDNLLCLQKTNKTLDIGQDDLRLWSENRTRKWISSNRTVNGMPFKDYELYYLDSCPNL